MSSISKQFDVLCENAVRAFDEELDVSYESTLLEILNFVKSNPACRAEFIDKFKEILLSPNSPFEAVAFCMHELQWQEIKEFVVEKMNSSNDPRSEALRSVVNAYEKDWVDADLYEYYGR